MNICRKILRIEPDIALRWLGFKLTKFTLQSAPKGDGKIELGKSPDFQGGNIFVDATSSFSAGDNFVNCAFVQIGNHSSMTVGNRCTIKNAEIAVKNNSRLILGDGVFISAPWSERVHISIDNGYVELAEKVRIFGNLSVRFGGRLRIGDWTGVGLRTHIRCENRITIGAYGLISYDVAIFDTNSHSLDWKERRRVIEQGYPYGAHEEQVPDTAPVNIGDDVWIGRGSTIAKGASIGDRCIVGMGTNAGGMTLPDDSIAVSPQPRVLPGKQL